MKRYDQLTFTRFWALLFVLIYHGTGGIYATYINFFPISPLLRSAANVVCYLYVLSGFVMSLVYYRPQEKFEITKYWTARFIRLYPMYIISFILVCYYYMEALPNIKPQKILANLFVMQAWWPAYAQSFNYASWSLTVEIFFYAIFPFFVLWAYRQPVRRMLWAAVIFWIITQIINYVLWVGYFPAQELIILYNPVFHLSTFILGVAGGAWFMQEGRHQIIDQRINFFILVFTLALITIYAILSETYQQLPHFLQPLMGTLAPLFVLFISALALDQTRLSKILSHKWLVALGETSYALYILHVPVIWLYERALHSSGLQDPEYIKSLTSFPLMILIGLIVTFYIEPPARAWLKNIVKQISIPLLLLDMVILTVSIFLSFRLRFDTEREYLAYREMGILIFWSAFFFRNIISYFFNTLSPDLLHKPILEMGRQLLFSTAAGSLVVSLIVLMGYRAGWYINFPRSVFMADFLIVFVLSFLIRYIFRVSNLYRPAVTA